METHNTFFYQRKRGMTLIDVIVGVALLVLVFYGLFGAFRLSIILIGSNKAKVGATALANEKMESIRSLAYTDIGTVGGIPAGALPQTEVIPLNQTTYTRRTFITYVDDPADGTGGADTNAITADYKKIKVELSWTLKGRDMSYAIVSTVAPKGIETTNGGGTLKISVFDALALPVGGASVRIQNNVISPPVDVTTFTNTSGEVIFPGGTPAGSGYNITVSKSGYSTTGTYTASAGNPNPSPADLSVVVGGTTTGSFAIDILSPVRVRTYDPIRISTFLDSFDTTGNISRFSTTSVSGGDLMLAFAGSEYAPYGEAESMTISSNYLRSWEEFAWSDTTDADTTARYQLLYLNGSVFEPIPEVDLLGNTAGFTTSPVSLVSLATTTYQELRILGIVETTDPNKTPLTHHWQLSYSEGPIPRINIPVTLTSTKTIGTDSGGAPLYKHILAQTTGSDGLTIFDNVEWDSYTLVVDGAGAGFDIAEACPALPVGVLPNNIKDVSLFMEPHTTNSLRVGTVDEGGAVLVGALVHITATGYSEMHTTGPCGQTLFPALSSSASYQVEVGKAGHATTTLTEVGVTGTDALQVVVPSL